MAENKRRAHTCAISAAGRRRIGAEHAQRDHFALSMRRVLRAE